MRRSRLRAGGIVIMALGLGTALPMTLAATGSPFALLSSPEADALGAERAALARARAVTAQAAARAATLAADAASARTAGERAQAQARALGGKIVASRAALADATAELALIRAQQRMAAARLAAAERPLSRLFALLLQVDRRPALLMLAAPQSTGDLMHSAMLLRSVSGQVRARSRGLRDLLLTTSAMTARARLAVKRQADAQATLSREQQALEHMAQRQGRAAVMLAARAAGEGDRVIAGDERQRMLVERIDRLAEAAAVAADLADLPIPVPRPDYTPAAAFAFAVAPAPAYRLPAEGRLVEGLGELRGDGTRSRGLALAVRAGAAVVAPGSGRIVYAGAFGSFGGIVIVDHGHGYMTLIARLAALTARQGDAISAGAMVGRAEGGDRPLIVELRRDGVPVDLTALLRSDQALTGPISMR